MHLVNWTDDVRERKEEDYLAEPRWRRQQPVLGSASVFTDLLIPLEKSMQRD